jgi:hypothetical protein
MRPTAVSSLLRSYDLLSLVQRMGCTTAYQIRSHHLSQNYISRPVSAYKTLSSLGLIRVQAKNFFCVAVFLVLVSTPCPSFRSVTLSRNHISRHRTTPKLDNTRQVNLQ